MVKRSTVFKNTHDKNNRSSLKKDYNNTEKRYKNVTSRV